MSVRWVAFWVATAALAGCGTPDRSSIPQSAASKSATIRAWTRTEQLLSDRTHTVSTQRGVVIQVSPHCVDGSRTLDCEGLYTFAVWYRFGDGTPKRPRCSDELDVSFQFSGGDGNGVACRRTASGALSLTSVVAVGTTPTRSPVAPPRVTMQLTVDRTGAQRYEWRSRDGSHCEGPVATAGPGRAVECSWS